MPTPYGPPPSTLDNNATMHTYSNPLTRHTPGWHVSRQSSDHADVTPAGPGAPRSRELQSVSHPSTHRDRDGPHRAPTAAPPPAHYISSGAHIQDAALYSTDIMKIRCAPCSTRSWPLAPVLPRRMSNPSHLTSRATPRRPNRRRRNWSLRRCPVPPSQAPPPPK